MKIFYRVLFSIVFLSAAGQAYSREITNVDVAYCEYSYGMNEASKTAVERYGPDINDEKSKYLVEQAKRNRDEFESKTGFDVWKIPKDKSGVPNYWECIKLGIIKE